MPGIASSSVTLTLTRTLTLTLIGDSTWIPLDSTWAAGSLDGSYRFNKSFNEFWWCTPPDHFIYSHLSEDPQWTCLPNPPTVEEFGKTLNLKGGFFTSGLAMKTHQEILINAKPGSKFTIEVLETGPRRWLMSNVEGDSNAVKLSYDNGKHMLVVTAPRVKKQYDLDIFFGPQQYGSYDHLVGYKLNVKCCHDHASAGRSIYKYTYTYNVSRHARASQHVTLSCSRNNHDRYHECIIACACACACTMS